MVQMTHTLEGCFTLKIVTSTPKGKTETLPMKLNTTNFAYKDVCDGRAVILSLLISLNLLSMAWDVHFGGHPGSMQKLS